MKLNRMTQGGKGLVERILGRTQPDDKPVEVRPMTTEQFVAASAVADEHPVLQVALTVLRAQQAASTSWLASVPLSGASDAQVRMEVGRLAGIMDAEMALTRAVRDARRKVAGGE